MRCICRAARCVPACPGRAPPPTTGCAGSGVSATQGLRAPPIGMDGVAPLSGDSVCGGRGESRTLLNHGRWNVANQVRLQLFLLAYNLGNFFRRLGLPKAIKYWSLRSVQVKLIKIGGRLVRDARRLVFQLAEVGVPRAHWQVMPGAWLREDSGDELEKWGAPGVVCPGTGATGFRSGLR